MHHAGRLTGLDGWGVTMLLPRAMRARWMISIVFVIAAIGVAGCGKVSSSKPDAPRADAAGSSSSACVLDHSQLDGCTL